jgi:PPK2 family polyphosphate:nucleotide phosphotransferase
MPRQTMHQIMKKIDLSSWRIRHGSACDLNDFSTQPEGALLLDEDQVRQQTQKLSVRLNKLQTKLHAANSHAVLLVLQGMDTSGKDGVIRHVFANVSPLGVRAVPFSAPAEAELQHDFLWRIHNKVPARGELVIFNRSHYEDVLVTRVHKHIDKATCSKRYEHIANFESLLHDSGTTIVKCYLHISKREQKKRLQQRIDDPDKHWKLQPSDFSDRRLWSQFISAYEDTISATSTKNAPWYIVPADSKPHRDLFIATLLVQTLESMDLTLPKPNFSLDDVTLT